MRFLSISLCAATLAASIAAFDICWAIGCYKPTDSPAVSITLEIKGYVELYYPVVRIDLEKSDEVCDPSGVRIFGQPLDVKDGRGRGVLQVSDNYSIMANWEFSCATPKDSSTEHKLVLNIESIKSGVSEEDISGVNVVARFRQTHPVVFTSIESEALAENPLYSRGTLHYGPSGPEPDTEMESPSSDL